MKLKNIIQAAALSALLAGGAQAATIQVNNADITGTVNWYRTNTYVLNGFVYVEAGEVLNIEAGTVVKAKPGTGAAASALIAARGGKVFAEGTPDKPIIFTAEADNVDDAAARAASGPSLTPFQRGLWGGVVLLGRATINSAENVTGNAATPKYEVYEGLADLEVHRFGGSDDDDSSGVLRYVSIRHGGTLLESNKEINGLSCGGVGRGTTLEYIEAYAIADDGFEFFGGTVNTRYLVSAFCDDDSFDTDMGYRGKNQFWFSIQDPLAADKGGEFDGDLPKTGVLPKSDWQVWNWTAIGKGISTGTALHIRDNAAAKIRNSIFAEFGTGLLVDANTHDEVTGGEVVIQNSIFNVTTPNTTANAADTYFTNALNANTLASPQFRGLSRATDGVLDPRLAAGAPALTGGQLPPNDGFLTPVTYQGAFDGNNLWFAKWTALYEYGFVLPSSPTNRVVNIADADFGVNTTAVTWYRTNTYVLNGFVYVKNGQTLTIEAGTVIKSKPGNGAAASALFIAQGGKLFAVGSPNNPIIFTAEADNVNDPKARRLNGPSLTPFQRGLWGGIVVLGRATINSAENVTGNAATPKYEIYEGLADAVINGQSVHRFGGGDDDDNSGIIRYVSIRHGGTLLESNKELNGLSLGGVGRGTTVEFVEAYAIADDGFEFFGGTVNTRYLISAFNDDDSFDTDMGYRGKNQFWFGIQDTAAADKGAEIDGDLPKTGVLPASDWQVWNWTAIGKGIATGTALHIRDNAAPKINNSIFADFGTALLVDANTLDEVNGGSLTIRNTIFNVTTLNTSANAADAFFTNAANANTTASAQLRGISRVANSGALDPRLAVGSPGLTGASLPPVDGFLVNPGHQGAFGNVNWGADWTALGDYGFFNARGAGVAIAGSTGTAAPAIVTQPALAGLLPATTVRLLQGSPFVIGVNAIGSTLAYQWYLNGNLIAGANGSTYSLATPAPANSGAYTVVVSNSSGSVTSSVPVNLTIVADPFTGFVNQGLVGVGRIAANQLDATGLDTLGGLFSAMTFVPNSWSASGGSISGRLVGLPDRGFGDGAQDYRTRLQFVDFSITPVAPNASGPLPQNQILMANVGTLLLRPSANDAYTGFNPDDTNVVGFPQSKLTGLGAGKRSLDPEGIVRLADGSYFISDEYGAFVYRFGADGILTATLPVPAALIPQKTGGFVAYDANATIVSGRRSNRGIEGLSASPDGRRLFAMLQSPTIQDSGAANASQHTRILVYDIEAASPNFNGLIGEYVYQLTLRGDASSTRHTPVSEVFAVNDHQLLVLERDGIGLGGTLGAPIYKKVNLVELNGASNILGTDWDKAVGTAGQKNLPALGDQLALTNGIIAAIRKDFVDLLNTVELAKFGMNAGAARDNNTVPEKYEGLALVPLNEPGAPNDWLMLVGTDNDYRAATVIHNGVSVGSNSGTNGIADTMVFAYRLTIPGLANPLPAAPGNAPAITTQPVGQTVVQGSNVVLSAGFTGQLPATFQWYKNGVAIPGANNPTLTLNNVRGSAGLDHTGPSSSRPPFQEAVDSGYALISLMSVGDTVNNKADGVTPHRLVGLLDGLGAFDNGNGTFTVLANHEIGANLGVIRAHGSNGAFVSKIIIAKSNLTVLNVSDLATNIQIWNGSSFVQSNTTIARLCSADLPAVSAFHFPGGSVGTPNRIFMNGEESSNGRGFAFVATGPDAGKAWELPYLGKFAWENSVASPHAQAKTIVMGLDDDGTTDSQVYVWIGNKQATGLDIEKAGLQNGSLWGVQVTGLAQEVTATTAAQRNFTLFNFGDVRALSEAQLETFGNTNGVTAFQRVEDGVWDPANPRDFYFVTTASFTGNSRLWRMRFTDIANPEAGGVLDMLLDGTEGPKMMDNIGIDPDGNLLIQEDPGNQAHIAKTWKYVVATDSLVLVSQHRPTLFTTGQPGFLTQDEEASGIIDVSSILGYRAYLIADQAHSTTGIPAGLNTTELRENGQLQLMVEVANGNYQLVIANSSGSVTSAVAVVDIATAPAFGDTLFRTGLPGATVSSGGTLTLTVPVGAFVGSGPFSYQWFLNNVAITGANSSTLALSGFTSASAGNYTVRVSNAAGKVTSVAVPISTADIAFFGGISLDGPAGAKYRFEYLADISNTNSWTTLTNIVHSGGRQFYIDTTSSGTQRRFFRAVPTP